LPVAVKQQPKAWARLWRATKPEFNPSLRHGAWYPVVSQGETLVVLEVRGRRISVPADLVELRPKRPDHFTVVHRTASEHEATGGTRRDLGRAYAVCPVSGSRVRIRGHPDELDCPQCGHHGAIAWWEAG
jgi:hypothetical protein